MCLFYPIPIITCKKNKIRTINNANIADNKARDNGLFIVYGT